MFLFFHIILKIQGLRVTQGRVAVVKMIMMGVTNKSKITILMVFYYPQNT